jgi:hypothetical protein
VGSKTQTNCNIKKLVSSLVGKLVLEVAALPMIAKTLAGDDVVPSKTLLLRSRQTLHTVLSNKADTLLRSSLSPPCRELFHQTSMSIDLEGT